MSATPSSLPAQPETTAERRLRIVRELTDIGIAVARVLGAQIVQAGEAAIASAARSQPQPQGEPPAEPPAPPPGQADTVLALGRISRAVRQGLALEHLLEQQPPAPTARPAILRIRLQRRKTELRRQLSQVIESETAPEEIEATLLELDERLDDPEAQDDLVLHRLPDIIAGLRRDLGLSAPPGTVTEAQLAALFAESEDEDRLQAASQAAWAVIRARSEPLQAAAHPPPSPASG